MGKKSNAQDLDFRPPEIIFLFNKPDVNLGKEVSDDRNGFGTGFDIRLFCRMHGKGKGRRNLPVVKHAG